MTKLTERGLKPGPWCSKLKSGESVQTPNGDTVSFIIWLGLIPARRQI